MSALLAELSLSERTHPARELPANAESNRSRRLSISRGCQRVCHPTPPTPLFADSPEIFRVAGAPSRLRSHPGRRVFEISQALRDASKRVDGSVSFAFRLPPVPQHIRCRPPPPRQIQVEAARRQPCRIPIWRREQEKAAFFAPDRIRHDGIGDRSLTWRKPILAQFVTKNSLSVWRFTGSY